MKKIYCLLCIILFFAISTTLLNAANIQEIKKVKSLVNKALNYLKKGGDISEFNKRNSKFVQGNLYVFVYNCKDNGVILAAHPYLAGKLVGKSVATIKDKRGKFFCLNLCRKVKENPDGVWDNYYWINTKTHKIEEKFTYIKQVPGKPYQVAVGAYKSDLGNITLDELNRKYK